MQTRSPIRAHAAAALAAWLLLPTAASAALIGLDPAAQTVDLGEAVSVDVAFSGLGGEIVSAYDLDILYDSAVLAATDVVFTTQLGDALLFEVLEDFDLSEPGVVDLAQLSLLPDEMLFDLQGGDAVTVATLGFEAVGAGSTQLEFLLDAANDVKGREGLVLPVEASGGTVTVRGDLEAPIPEPGSI